MMALEEDIKISHELAKWYNKNKRSMPWRNTRDPYIIWLSEIILQQTQVVQGTPYFERFISEFPTIKQLAEASEDKVLKLWQGLGYYSRARNLLYTAKNIYYELGNIFPANYSELLKLKGVGEYTAAAIASIAYNESKAVVDGNVVRVISRLFEIKEPFNSVKGKKSINEIAYQILNKNNPAEHNQAMMELGSLVCRPKNPDCNNCPLKMKCLCGINGTVLNYPVKTKKAASQTRHFNFVVPMMPNGKTFITKRTGNDIWKNMFTFPLYETLHASNEVEIVPMIKRDFGDFELLHLLKLNHVLSHRLINASFYIISINKANQFTSNNEVSEPENIAVLNAAVACDIKNKYKVTFEKNNIFEVEIKSLKEYYSLPRLITKCMESKDVSYLF